MASISKEEFVESWLERSRWPGATDAQVRQLLDDVEPVECDGNCGYDACRGWIMTSKRSRTAIVEADLSPVPCEACGSPTPYQWRLPDGSRRRVVRACSRPCAESFWRSR